MATTRISANVWLPNIVAGGNSATGTYLTIDATGEKACVSGRIWAPGWTSGTKNISRVIFRLNTCVSAGGSGWTISLQDVLLTGAGVGAPDETQDQTVALSAATVGTGAKWVRSGTFSAARTVNCGDLVAVVWEYDGSGRLGSDSLVVARLSVSNARFPMQMGAHSLLKTGGTWALGTTGEPNIIFEFDDGSYGTFMGGAAGQLPGSPTANTTTGLGNLFTVPTTLTAEGIWLSPSSIATGDAVNVCLYQGNTRLVTVAVDGDLYYPQNADGFYVVPIPAQTLVPGVTYGVSLEPTSGDAWLFSEQYYDAAAKTLIHPDFSGASVTIATPAWGAAETTIVYYIGIVVGAIGGSVILVED